MILKVAIFAEGAPAAQSNVGRAQTHAVDRAGAWGDFSEFADNSGAARSVCLPG